MSFYVSRIHFLLFFVFLLLIVAYLSGHELFSQYMCPVCEPKPEPMLEPINRPKEGEMLHCPESRSRWTIGDLKHKPGLTYTQPSAQKGRTDVNPVTNWNAPLVWEGTFDPVVIDAIYKRMDPRIAVVVFAVGKYTRFLKDFLETGEKYFLVDFRVTYYIFTDNEKEVPPVKMGEGRRISVVSVPSANRWQDVVLGRMKWATITIDKQIRNESDYLFMMDIDSVFRNRFGAESLSRLSAVLHRGYYKTTRNNFPYERRPQSTAYIPADEGDYYYTAAVWGGYLEDMYKLVRYCYEQSLEDARNHIEAVWQEESHLNKYLLYNKPTKVLSPEYLWSDYDQVPADIKVVRISQLVKNYAEVRPNGSAHTVLGGYWSKKLGKKKLLAYQCSSRGGELELEVRDDGGISITGQTVTVLQGTITL